ncbi:BZ3500_MvSof-1268-A1-R1_Chr8-2g10060 [Microbotryum saponariae]|uniref:BZ3500_MvSof-1268-A1-R1_Chr8-2g10060 protein n=1 Tax=Microbotryum saponariae TaxID=289078 RepID=A0A2X0N3P7_9BASI|nr:BZ3500_MvSof-1268-A1-R1_Chr8-2g10060 [Microbotryum saponariae]SDA01702.1 BZ3501_MvSof-1269-A2-R1_Chr8-2g09810 [Microbotryum saponariae]
MRFMGYIDWSQVYQLCFLSPHKVLNGTSSGGSACFPVDGLSDHIVERGSISPPASQKPKNASIAWCDIAGDHTGHLDSANETSRRSLAMLGNAKTLACLAMLLAPRTTVGSIGDLSPSYQRCVDACSNDCPRPTPLLWSCRDDCQYRCTQHLTDLSLRTVKSVETREYVVDMEGLPLGEQVQYHGKWAFHRLGGPVKIQEPLSVVFSLGNLVAHHRGLMKLSRHTKFHHDGSQSPRLVYRIYALFGINAWIWSCVFHIRDLSWTEKADYFGAAALMVCGLWAAVMRISGLSFTFAATTRRVALAWTVSCAFLVIAHCWYLTRKERFDYDYNMRFNIATAIATILLWSAWSFYHCILIDSPSAEEPTMFLAPGHQPAARSQTTRAPHACMPVLPLILLPLLTSLELLDFAPIGVFGLRLLDAHALWHASTIPVVWTCCCSVCPCQPPHTYILEVSTSCAKMLAHNTSRSLKHGHGTSSHPTVKPILHDLVAHLTCDCCRQFRGRGAKTQCLLRVEAEHFWLASVKARAGWDTANEWSLRLCLPPLQGTETDAPTTFLRRARKWRCFSAIPTPTREIVDRKNLLLRCTAIDVHTFGPSTTASR